MFKLTHSASPVEELQKFFWGRRHMRTVDTPFSSIWRTVKSGDQISIAGLKPGRTQVLKIGEQLREIAPFLRHSSNEGTRLIWDALCFSELLGEVIAVGGFSLEFAGYFDVSGSPLREITDLDHDHMDVSQFEAMLKKDEVDELRFVVRAIPPKTELIAEIFEIQPGTEFLDAKGQRYIMPEGSKDEFACYRKVVRFDRNGKPVRIFNVGELLAVGPIYRIID
jgi:hypothetical protein